ncbi:MAG TPA: glycosyltransferase [Candidatus Saccharimonadales bacterium]|nr:glycosyltransferase [Candidatus Saccharimonadales bacterium]
MKVALVYDRVNKWGGAERVLLALHAMFPHAPLFTSVYNPKTASWAKVFAVKTSFLQHIPFVRSHHQLFPFLMPLAFESFSFDDFDLVISVTSEAAKGIITKPHTRHICLCLTPTRYLWSGYAHYFNNAFFRFLATPVIQYLRTWDSIASQRPDTMVAISEEVRKRIKKYYQRESIVIYPPYMLTETSVESQKGEYFLVVSRLSRFTSYKRVDIAVQAATKLNIPLKIIGEGDIEYYKKIAGPTVEFLGKVSDTDLLSYYAGCCGLIFPGIEDFGLVMVEAQAMGKPVIALRGGGALEIVKEGETGEFFDRQTVESLSQVLKSFDGSRYNKETCKQNAKRFSLEAFQKKVQAVTS